MGQLAGSGLFAQTGLTSSLATRAESSRRCLSSKDCSNFCKGTRTISSAMVSASIRQTEPNAVCLGVRDTGPGLSAETLPRLFESFYTTKPDGMGMGLSICRSIIEAHGGRLWATRCEPRGALFQFDYLR